MVFGFGGGGQFLPPVCRSANFFESHSPSRCQYFELPQLDFSIVLSPFNSNAIALLFLLVFSLLAWYRQPWPHRETHTIVVTLQSFNNHHNICRRSNPSQSSKLRKQRSGPIHRGSLIHVRNSRQMMLIQHFHLSLQTHIMNYWSRLCSWYLLAERLINPNSSQRVLVERTANGWKLYTRTPDRQGVVWEGLSCYT